MEKNERSIFANSIYDKVGYLLLFFLMPITSSFCKRNKQTASICPSYIALTWADYKTIDEISMAEGYERSTVERGSFGESMRGVKLKEDSRIYLYNQSLVQSQGGSKDHYTTVDFLQKSAETMVIITQVLSYSSLN